MINEAKKYTNEVVASHEKEVRLFHHDITIKIYVSMVVKHIHIYLLHILWLGKSQRVNE